MKLLLLSLVLFGLALIAQSGTVEKREANEEDPCSLPCDTNGCKKWCNGKWHDPGKREAVVKRETGLADALFKADNSTCKCLHYGYCLEIKRGEEQYTQVPSCGKRKCYNQCDATGCREVCDGSCTCDDYGRCEVCDDKGCKQTPKCAAVEPTRVTPTECKECNAVTGCTDVACHFKCNDNVLDRMVEDKCTSKKHDNGTVTYQLCDQYRCNNVLNCDRFASCRCNKGRDADEYSRCYGYKNGKQHCRALYTCTQFKRQEKQWNADEAARIQALEDQLAAAKRELERLTSGRSKRETCDCPSDGGLCKECDFLGRCSYVNECGISSSYIY